MRNFRMTLAYDGSRFHGWQRQTGFPSVQEALELALERVTGAPTPVSGAGRTDAGVHALRQAASFRSSTALVPSVLRRALNAHLPAAVRIGELAEAAPSFDARRSALAKRYAYRLWLGAEPPPFGRELFTPIRFGLCIPKMREAAKEIAGRRDFAAFATNPGYDPGPTVRTVQRLHLLRRRRFLWVAVQGDGFLYNMVRTMAGTLVEVGRGRFTPDEVGRILASRDRRRAGPVLPPGGLFLVRVLYRVRGRQAAAAGGAAVPPPPLVRAWRSSTKEAEK